MIRIVRGSNFDDENYDEVEVTGIVVLNKKFAQKVCNVLNEFEPTGPHYYKVVDSDYQLHKRQA